MTYAHAARAALLALAMGGGAAPLAAQAYDPERVVKSVSQADLAAVVRGLEHEVREQGSDGETFVIAQDANGLTYALYGTACNAGSVAGCQGVLMQLQFDLPESVTFDSVNATNEEQAAVSMTADFAAGTMTITRYQVLDNGVTMANIRANVAVLLNVGPSAVRMVMGEE